MAQKPHRKVAMCLMAHPDDCEILAAGTLALLAERGWEVHIASMTPGDCGTAELGPEQIAAIRRAEGAAGAKMIGATYHCLESRDLYVMYDEPTVRKATGLMRSIGPTLVFTHSLDDYVMDHERTARVARGATFGFAVPNTVTGPISPDAGTPYLYYADPIEGTDVYGHPVQASTYVNITAVMKTKTKMLKCHASQRQWLMKHHGMDQYVRTMQQWCARRAKEMTVRGVRYAEAFRQHRGHPYPHDCVLAREMESLVQNT